MDCAICVIFVPQNRMYYVIPGTLSKKNSQRRASALIRTAMMKTPKMEEDSELCRKKWDSPFVKRELQSQTHHLFLRSLTFWNKHLVKTFAKNKIFTKA